MSNLKVNTINDASGGSAAVLYGVASPPNSMGFRNRIINGGMVIDQRNAGASVNLVSSGNTFVVDRFFGYAAQNSKLTAQRNAGAVTPPVGFTNYIGATSAATWSAGASENFLLGQLIEGFNVADLGWGASGASSVTLSFWVRSSLTGTFSGSVSNGAADRTYAFSFSVGSANTWEQKTVTIPGDTSGSWTKDNGLGIRLYFDLGCGSSSRTTAGSWSSGFFIGATGANSLGSASGATFYITGVQLEAGTVATPFERRDYGRELMMCQRYFERIDAAAGGIVTLGQAYATSAAFVPISFRTTKRASPTFSTTGTWSGTTATGSDSGGSLSLTQASTDFARLALTGATGLVAGNATSIFPPTSAASMQFSAEL